MEQALSLAQILKQAIDNRLLDIHTALIGKIETYDAARQLADIKPVAKCALRDSDGALKQEDLPLLVDVPILFPRAGGFFISLPIQAGDFVQVIFNEGSIDEFLTESSSTISSAGRFTLQGAVALPGLYPEAKALVDAHETNLVLGRERGTQIHVDDKKIYLGSDKASEALALASKVKEELDRIKSVFNNHTHLSSTGPIKPSDKIIASSNIATMKVVAE
jgi:hypothetical protein